MAIQAADRERSPDLVFRYLQDKIVSGELQPGERIDLDQVSEDVGVSRTPVREALMRLETEGLVDRRPYRGAVVRGVDATAIAEIYGLRIHLEGLAARLAVTRLTDDDVAALESHHGDLLAVVEGSSEPLAGFNEHNAAFHDVIYRAAGVESLRTNLIALNRQCERARMHIDVRTNLAVHDEHTAIIEASRARDADRLEMAVRQHILHACVLFLSRLSPGGEMPPMLREVLTDAELSTVRIGLSVAAANDRGGSTGDDGSPPQADAPLGGRKKRRSHR